MCTDGSVKLQVLDNGHTKASLGAGLSYRQGYGEDLAIGIEGRADAYQAEAGGADIALVRHAHDVLYWGCNTKALLQGLQAWQHTLFRPSPYNQRMRPALQRLVETAATQTRPTHAFWVKAHAGHGGNEGADILAKA